MKIKVHLPLGEKFDYEITTTSPKDEDTFKSIT